MSDPRYTPPWERDWRSPSHHIQSAHPNGRPAATMDRTSNFYNHYGVAFKGAASNNYPKGTIPKNFTQPLTCFYWDQGYCNKTAEECLYAHHHTGVVAEPPLPISKSKGESGSVAGRNAEQYLQNQAVRENELKIREAVLAAREMELNGRVNEFQYKNEKAVAIERIYEIIANGKATTAQARAALIARRQEVSEAGMLDVEEGKALALSAIENMTAIVNTIDMELLDLEHGVEARFGKNAGA